MNLMKTLHTIAYFLLMATVLYACGEDGDRETIDSPQIALAELKGQTITFTCLTNQETCWKPVNLAAQLPIDGIFTLGPTFHLNSSRLFALVSNTHPFPWEQYVILVDSTQPNFQSLQFPVVPGKAMYAVVGEKLVVAQYGETKIWLIDQNLKSEQIDVGIAVKHLVVKDEASIILLNDQPHNESNRLFIDLAVLAINSAQLQPHHLEIPGFELIGPEMSFQADRNYLVSLEGVSRDLQQAYGLFLNGSAPKILQLGAFSLGKTFKPPVAVQGIQPSATVGFAQYQEILFTASLGGGYNRGGGILIDMTHLKAFGDAQANPDPGTGKKLVVPFGDTFLIGTNSRVFQIDMQGAIVNRFSLPENIGENYTMMIYQK